MMRTLPRRLPLLLAGLVLCLPVHAQDQPSLGDAARQAKAAKSAQSKKAAKVITNDDLSAAKVTGRKDRNSAPFFVELRDDGISLTCERETADGGQTMVWRGLTTRFITCVGAKNC
jgi:hypothetical protein